MANVIKGITIELNGETSKLDKALKETSSKSRSLQGELKQVERALKFDPKNTELLAQKQKILTEAVGETKNRLDILKDAERQVQEQFARGEASEEQYRAVQREVINTENELKKLRTAAAESNDALADVASAAGRISEGSAKLGNALMPVTAAVGALGAGAAAAWSELDTGYDTIITKTGATGDVLEGLQNSMNEVFNTLPTDATTAGVAIGEVNTRFGATGKTLERLSSQYIQFAEINGTDLNNSIDQTDKIMTAFGVEADRAGEVLGLLTKAGQDTGLSMDTLYSQLEKNGATLRGMGLGLTESVNLLARMETAGVDSSAALAGLRKAQQNAAKDGKSLSSALGETIDKIRGAKDETEAAQVAAELFGAKGAAEMAQSIREGRFSLDDLTGSLEDYAGTVEDTFNATLDPPDQARIALNNLKTAGADLAGVAMETVAPCLTQMVDKVKEVTSWARNLDEGQKQTIIRALAVAAAIGPGLIAFSKLAGGVSTAFTALSRLRNGIAGAGGLTNALGAVVSPAGVIIAIVAALAAGFVYLYQTNDEFRAKVLAMVETVKSKFEEMQQRLQPTIDFIIQAFNDLMEKLAPVGEFLTTLFFGLINGLVDAAAPFTDAITAIIETITNLIAGFLALLNGDTEAFYSYMLNALGTAIAAVEGIISAAIALIEGTLAVFGTDIQTLFSTIWAGIQAIFAAVGEWFGARFTEAWNAITTAFAAAGSWAAEKWAAITSVFSVVDTWMSNKFGSAWTAVKNVFAGWGAFFAGLWDRIRTTFSSLGSSIADAIGGAVRNGINGVIGMIEGTINNAIGIINGAINLINAIPGVSVGTIGGVGLPRLAKGGVLSEGSAMVAEAGPEIISMVNGKTIVTPLSRAAKNTPVGSGGTEINVNIENFNNNTGEDVKKLTRDVLEEAEEIREREELAFA